MKLTITYEYQPQYELKYWAEVKVNGNLMRYCGNSFDEAKRRLLEAVAKAMVPAPPVPEPEEVEV